ncbi:NAD-dependent epimerase/dehydratase family protein [bacterium]|nr:NAD-dependent epimerase/dehydratase family protein [bacterium]
MEVLVLGGTRFFGHTLVHRLVAHGHAVTVLTRGNLPVPTGAHHLKADRTDPAALAAVLSGRRFDVVIDNVAFTGADVEGILGALRDRLGHYVLVSTESVYAEFTGLRMYHESEVGPGNLQPIPGLNPYAEGKREAERVLWERQGTIPPFTIVRPGFVVGPHDYTRRFDFFLQRVLDGGPILLPDGLPSIFQLSWHEDVCAVILATLQAPKAYHRAYHAVGAELFTYQTLVATLAGLAGSASATVSVSREALEAQGLADYGLPYGGPGWVLVGEGGRTRDELNLVPTPASVWMPQLVAHRRAHPHEPDSAGYARRTEEVRLALRSHHAPTH